MYDAKAAYEKFESAWGPLDSRAPYPDTAPGFTTGLALYHFACAAEEIQRLRKCLADTREEICTGPVDDVLWHKGVPSCTTVDNITLTLGDDWSYDTWAQEVGNDQSRG